MSPNLTANERTTTVVFGDTFSLYDDESFAAFIEPLKLRLARNGVDLDVFAGKRCLDAGCGGGRASIMMAEAGAAEVVGVDLSETNVETCRGWARHRALENCSFQQGSLVDLPFEDESFDIVWSNGVLHHTGATDATLKEITRTLRQGGSMWLYLYGSGGIYWYVIDWIRATLQSVRVPECIAQLQLQNMETRRIAERIDNWFVPVLQRYTIEDVRVRLEELGFEDAAVLTRGTPYDTSERRRSASAEEIELMGDGDLRYFAQKTSAPRGTDEHALPDAPDGKGSHWTDGPGVTQVDSHLDRVRTALERLETARGSEANAYRIMVCSLVHDSVRSLIETEHPFEMTALTDRMNEIASICDALAGA